MEKIRRTLTEPEGELATSANSGSEGTRAEVRILAELHVARRHREMVDDLIESNEALAAANTKYAKGLLFLTGGLVFVGLLPYLVTLLRLIVSLLN